MTLILVARQYLRFARDQFCHPVPPIGRSSWKLDHGGLEKPLLRLRPLRRIENGRSDFCHLFLSFWTRLGSTYHQSPIHGFCSGMDTSASYSCVAASFCTSRAVIPRGVTFTQGKVIWKAEFCRGVAHQTREWDALLRWINSTAGLVLQLLRFTCNLQQFIETHQLPPLL